MSEKLCPKYKNNQVCPSAVTTMQTSHDNGRGHGYQRPFNNAVIKEQASGSPADTCETCSNPNCKARLLFSKNPGEVIVTPGLPPRPPRPYRDRGRQ